jgi:DNA (cytosine-5)-methyltransferase 1
MYRNNVKDITDRYEDLVAPTRQLLIETGRPYVMENVPGAPLINPVQLCGSMFNLDVRRHRLFETSWFMLQPDCQHHVWTERKYKGSTNRGPRFTIEVGAWNEPIALQRAAMGIDWMQLRELSEAIPPAYTEWIGRQFAQQEAAA